MQMTRLGREPGRPKRESLANLYLVFNTLPASSFWAGGGPKRTYTGTTASKVPLVGELSQLTSVPIKRGGQGGAQAHQDFVELPLLKILVQQIQLNTFIS